VKDQLPLNIQLRDDATFASFYEGDNLQVVKALTQLARGLDEPFLYLWGQKGAGKSHLLQAACHAASELNVAAVYLPLQEWRNLSPLVLQDLEKVPLVCLDDIESIAGNELWEEALFHAFNRIRSQNVRLVISSETSPLSLPIQLPDLKSRLAWGVTYQLHRLNDEQKLAALILRAGVRGLSLNKTVGQFLLSRCPRDMNELFHTLERLDDASLSEQRRLTIPFVKQVLGV
jgi:DnaA family protein